MNGTSERILLFGGTTEARRIAEALARAGIPCTVSVATEYGENLISGQQGTERICGRKNAEEMAELMTAGGYTQAVDATHPYALEASRNIREACRKAGLPLTRIRRDVGTLPECAVPAGSLQAAAEILNRIPGPVLLLTGSKELPELCRLIRGHERLYARVLPDPEAVLLAREAGIPASHVIAMQGPFTAETNLALIRQVRAEALLTKRSGSAGGFEEKMEAAREAGIPAVVWMPPETEEEGITADEFLDRVLPEASRKRILTLVGTGPGGKGLWTRAAEEAVREADAVFGNRKVLQRAEAAGILNGSERMLPVYDGEGIRNALKENPEIRRAAALFSGDTGLYSGSSGVRSAFREEPGWEIRVIPGISAASLFAARTGTRIEDFRVLSSHGRRLSIVPHALSEPGILVYTAGREDALRMREELAEAVREGILPGSLEAACAADLSLPDECWTDLNLKGNCPELPEGLLLLWVRNPECGTARWIGDSDLVRTRVPMTKREIRILALAELGLRPGAVFWDIGSGTGSVSVQAALAFPDLDGYAVERDAEAADLTERNLRRFGCTNVRVVRGSAPEALDGLPAPTHVFLGGTGKASREILEKVLERSPDARIVAACITLDTLTVLHSALKELPVESVSIRQIAVTRAEHLGSSDLMIALNPVFLISCTGKASGEGENRNA